ncbi:MAG TPA: hypothetical protein VII47_15000 [Actinomycetota bacterium]
MPDIEAVWRRIQQFEGEAFHQIRGAPFTYRVKGAYLRPDRTPQNIPKSHVGKALELMPVSNTVPLQHLRGPSDLFAILMDPRITHLTLLGLGSERREPKSALGPVVRDRQSWRLSSALEGTRAA